jgi:acetolactate decarboxylase
VLATAALVLSSASAAIAASDDGAGVGVGRQVGTYDYLATPDYDGLIPARTAASGLTLGLGTFDRLDGELVLVGGDLLRVGVDGTPREVTDERTTPFFEGVRFRATRSAPVAPGTTCAQLADRVTEITGSSVGMVAVRVRGTFTDLVTRSVEPQQEPYPTLADAIAGQTVFPLGRQRAVLVGFWTGPTLLGVGAPGLHLHGVTADREAGGHVLSCVAGPDVQLSVQPLADVELVSVYGR